MSEISALLGLAVLYLAFGFAAALFMARTDMADDGTYGWALAITMFIFFWPGVIGLVVIPKVLILPGKLVGIVSRVLPPKN